MNIFTPANWYWKDATGAVYGSKKNAMLAPTDGDYVAWLKNDNYATVWPRDESGNQTKASLNAVLAYFNLPELA